MTDMTPPPPVVSQYLSILLNSWIMAMEAHLEELSKASDPSSPPSPRERSSSIAIVTMAVFAIESYAARLRIVKTWAADGPQAETGDDALTSFLRIGLSGFPRRLIDEVGEIVLLRNALAHNHVWLMRGTDELESFRSDAVQALLRREDRCSGSTRRRQVIGHRDWTSISFPSTSATVTRAQS